VCACGGGGGGGGGICVLREGRGIVSKRLGVAIYLKFSGG